MSEQALIIIQSSQGKHQRVTTLRVRSATVGARHAVKKHGNGIAFYLVISYIYATSVSVILKNKSTNSINFIDSSGLPSSNFSSRKVDSYRIDDTPTASGKVCPIVNFGTSKN